MAGKTERIRLKTAAKSSDSEPNLSFDPAVSPGEALWQYGWTHYGTSGQTPARLHALTHEVEVKDGDEWVRCTSGTDAFFTRDFMSA